MVCDVTEMASGVGFVWARRDGVGAVVAVSVAAVVPSSALPVSLLVASACACCSAVS